MERVTLDVARGDYPRVMTSTFRGRGSVAGLIFRPHLDHVEFVDEKRPVRVHFVFHEVLAPELVRGPGQIGDVFNILYTATRVRWEVLNPFLVKRFLAKGSSRFEISEDERNELIEQIANSIRVIDQEAERHGVAQLAANDSRTRTATRSRRCWPSGSRCGRRSSTPPTGRISPS